MRRLIGCMIVMMLALVAMPAQAQFKFGVKGGVNINTVSFNSSVLDAENMTGFQIGPMIEAGIPLLGAGFDLAVLYSKKGVSLNNNDFSSDYIDIPLNLKWKLALPIVKPYIAAGPYIGFRVAGDDAWETLQYDIKGKNFSAGLNFGAGVELFNHLQVGLNYGLGLTNNYSIDPVSVSDIDESDGKDRGWSITAAILF